jgi:hypothetical protein
VKVAATAPKMVVRGTGFAARERVLVTVAGQGVVKAHSITTLAGTFRVALKAPPAAACGRYFVRARGLKSLRTATLRLGAPECADPGSQPGNEPGASTG